MITSPSEIVCFWLQGFPSWAIGLSRGIKTPIAVVQSGRVISATSGALQGGVRMGMAADRVVDVSSRAKVFLRDTTCEQAMWDYTLERLHNLTPFLESVEPGLAYLCNVNKGDLSTLAAELGASVGFGPNRKIARLASARSSQGHVLTVSSRSLKGFLKHTSVEVFGALGFEAEVIERLQLFGYPTLGSAATLSEKHLTAQFGNTVGKELSSYLNPPPEKPIRLFRLPNAATATYCFEWDEDLLDETRFSAVTTRLVARSHTKLKGWSCRRIVVRLSDGKREHVATRVLPKATDKYPYLLRQAHALIRPLVERVTSFDTLRIEFRSFSVGESRQMGLWRSRPTLEDAARQIEVRFPGACVRTTQEPHALLQEDRFRYVPYVVLAEDER
ncbi:MAG: hypothetical protein R3284_04190 [Rubricoccaceae bacterium]|nr:hypothetical protein [Rubricoccaceae bacterium]